MVQVSDSRRGEYFVMIDAVKSVTRVACRLVSEWQWQGSRDTPEGDKRDSDIHDTHS